MTGKFAGLLSCLLIGNTNPHQHIYTTMKLTAKEISSTVNRILETETNGEFRIWLQALNEFPHSVWKLPLSNFIAKRVRRLRNGGIGLTKTGVTAGVEESIEQMRHLTRYLYAKEFGGDLLPGASIEDEMRTACQIIADGKMYIRMFELSPEYLKKLDDPIPKKLRWGFCAMMEFSRGCAGVELAQREAKLNRKQSCIPTISVENIVPRDWSRGYEITPDRVDDPLYIIWDSAKAEAVQNTLGNMVLMNKPLQIKGSKDFFIKKVNHPNGYRHAITEGAMLLSSYGENTIEWVYPFYEQRHAYSKRSVIEFLEYNNNHLIPPTSTVYWLQ